MLINSLWVATQPNTGDCQGPVYVPVVLTLVGNGGSGTKWNERHILLNAYENSLNGYVKLDFLGNLDLLASNYPQIRVTAYGTLCCDLSVGIHATDPNPFCELC